jgi:hypothetical protein
LSLAFRAVARVRCQGSPYGMCGEHSDKFVTQQGCFVSPSLLSFNKCCTFCLLLSKDGQQAQCHLISRTHNDIQYWCYRVVTIIGALKTLPYVTMPADSLLDYLFPAPRPTWCVQYFNHANHARTHTHNDTNPCVKYVATHARLRCARARAVRS